MYSLRSRKRLDLSSYISISAGQCLKLLCQEMERTLTVKLITLYIPSFTNYLRQNYTHNNLVADQSLLYF